MLQSFLKTSQHATTMEGQLTYDAIHHRRHQIKNWQERKGCNAPRIKLNDKISINIFLREEHGQNPIKFWNNGFVRARCRRKFGSLYHILCGGLQSKIPLTCGVSKCKISWLNLQWYQQFRSNHAKCRKKTFVILWEKG